MGLNTAQGIQTIEDPPEDGLGPAMLALPPAQRRFVMAMIHYGGTHKRCAQIAGYAENPANPNVIEVTAHRLAHNEKIQEAIREQGLRMMNAGSIQAVKFVLDLIADQSAEMKDRLKAAEMVMNRTGLHATSEHKVAVTHKSESSAELVKQITQLSKALGVDPQKLLGSNVVDAEFEEVKPELADDDLSDIL